MIFISLYNILETDPPALMEDCSIGNSDSSLCTFYPTRFQLESSMTWRFLIGPQSLTFEDVTLQLPMTDELLTFFKAPLASVTRKAACFMAHIIRLKIKELTVNNGEYERLRRITGKCPILICALSSCCRSVFIRVA